jgi:uncharacterized protein
MIHVTFAEIASVLSSSGSAVPAAESHGCLCGALCSSNDYSLDQWLDELVAREDRAADAGNEQALGLLFADTVEALRGGDMDFHPLLPDDDTQLEQRAAALAQWCQGFLYGFGTGRAAKLDRLPPAVDEILRDLTQIGRATADVGEGGEEEEEAYSEVVEYLRVGVQLIHDELCSVRDADQAPESPRKQ